MELTLTVQRRYDSKDVFKEGLLEIQARLEEMYYTSVQVFSEDLAAVFSSGVGHATITKGTEAEQQLSGVVHSSLSAEQKEKKKLAKRIIKGIQPLFDDALLKESDLAGRPFERDVPNLETLFEQKLQAQPPRPAVVQESVEDEAADVDAEGELVSQGSAVGRGVGMVVGKDSEAATAYAPTPEEYSEEHNQARDEAADEAAIAAQLGQDHVSSMDADSMDIDPVKVNDTRAAPPTPPGSDQDLLGPIHHGGIPWYMKEFDPEGTTVYEELPDSREETRELSEELSELDDDELNGLAAAEAMVSQAVVPEEVQKTVRNKRKRNRGYR